MIKKWRVEPAFTDHRGTIANIVPDELIEHIAVIVSKKGAVRGQHYHQQDSHYSYIVFGKCEYTESYEAFINLKASEVFIERETCILEAGDIVFTPPGIPHKFEFLEDSLFFAFATRKRMDGRYEEDTVPWKLD